MVGNFIMCGTVSWDKRDFWKIQYNSMMYLWNCTQIATNSLLLSQVIMKKIKLKPLSVNNAWQWRRFSTPEKKIYEAKLLKALEGTYLEGWPPYCIYFWLYISKMQDYDNSLKVSQDILCKFYGINDRDIYRAVIEKIPTKRGEEYFAFEIDSIK